MDSSQPPHTELSRRERQIMDVIHRRRQATVAEIQAEMPDDASYSAVRSALRLLRQKSVIEYEHDGKRYVYRATMPAADARESALQHVMRTFFQGSRSSTVSAILEMSDAELSDDELRRLEQLIREARGKRER